MTENLFEAKYDLTKKSKLKIFYESNKILIFFIIFLLIISFSYFSYYLTSKEKEKISISENYVKAKIFLENGERLEALKILKKVVYANEPAYSSLAFFMVLNQDLIQDHNEISSLFNHLLENNKFDEEIRNLLIYKKALYLSNYVDESKLLKEIKPLLNKKDSVWKAYALLLLGDYFMAKNENFKARDFYLQILSINNLQKEFYDEAKSQLLIIGND